MDYSPPGSSVHGTLQARILECPFPSPGDLPDPGTEPISSVAPALAGRFFTTELPGKAVWKILKEMGISDHLTCLLRNLYAGQEATARTGHGTTD